MGWRLRIPGKTGPDFDWRYLGTQARLTSVLSVADAKSWKQRVQAGFY